MTGQDKNHLEPRLAERISRLINWGHWFAFFNILLAMLIGSRYLVENGLPGSFLGLLYTLVTWVGHFGFLIFFLYILTLFPLTILLPLPRLLRAIGALLATIGQLTLLADTFVFSQYRLHLNTFIWELLASGEGQVLTRHYFTWMAFGGLAVLIFALQLVAGNYLWKRRLRFKEKRLGFHVATVFVLCFFSSHSLHIWADARLYYPILRQGAVFPLSYPATAKAFLASHGLLDMQEYNKKLRAGGTGQSMLKLPAKLSGCHANSPNVLMVVVEGLRADALNSKAMPNLWAEAQQSLNFTDHFAGANEPKDSLFSLFYGLPAVYQNAVKMGRDTPLLVSSYQQAGKSLGVFASDNFKQSELDKTIFDHADAPHFSGSVAQRDKQALSALTGWTAQHPHFFSYLQLGAPASFSTPKNYANPFQPDWPVVNLAELDNQSDATVVKNRYRNAVHYADGLLGKLFSQLKQQGIWDNTIVVVTSDHGMEFNDTGSDTWGYGSNFSRYQTQVPLVIHWPGMAAASYQKLTNHQDIAPTLLSSALQCQEPISSYSSGHSLLGPQSDPWVILGDFHQFAILQPDRVLVMNKMGQYSIRDRQYRPINDAHIRVAPMMDALRELKRFYR